MNDSEELQLNGYGSVAHGNPHASRENSDSAGAYANFSYDIDESQSLDVDAMQPDFLRNVVAFVEVYNDGGSYDATASISAQLREMGAVVRLDRISCLLTAQVVPKFQSNVTHVIWKDGTEQTYDRAKLDKILVSPLWVATYENISHVNCSYVTSCHELRCHCDETAFPPKRTKVGKSRVRATTEAAHVLHVW